MRYEKVEEFPNTSTGGYRAVYKLSDFIAFGKGESTRFVCADYAVTFDRGPETMLFPCDENGTVLDWSELWCDYCDTVGNDMAVEAFCKMLEEKGAE